MKRLFILTGLVILLTFSLSWGAAPPGTCAITYDSPGSDKLVVTFTCVASSGDATFPSTSTSATTLRGFYITEVRTNPGATQPQASYDIVINDADGIDLMGGTLANRSATASERAIPALATGIYGGTMIDGAITLVITGNNVNSAQTVVKVFLTK